MHNNSKILAVPTNIITGFLGVGKTSAITHLLTQKPEHERWAILVNEFGEIGIDGSLLLANTAEPKNIFIKELPGGCMCCTAGAPMRITLNKLLKEAKPHRLLIEPTGLGHPLEVLELLSNDSYKDVLNVQNTITLIDARNLSDSRYIEHETFNQQLEVADVIIGNKADLYNEANETQLKDYLFKIGKSAAKLYLAEHGQVSIDWLSGQANNSTVKASHHAHHEHKHEELEPINTRPYNDTGMLSAQNQGEGFKSVGWRFSNDKIFNRKRLINFLNSLNVLRVKAVFITDEGTFSYNKAGDDVSEKLITTTNESRIEIINVTIGDSWQENLIKTIKH